MISHKARYALRALIRLATAPAGKAVLAQEIADDAAIPRKFLEHILLDLKHSGLVASRRGRTGGYMLALAPESIRFGEVLRLIDGPIAPLTCLSRSAYRRCVDCPDEGRCGVRRVFAAAHEAQLRILDAATIADALPSGDGRSAGSRGEQQAVLVAMLEPAARQGLG